MSINENKIYLEKSIIEINISCISNHENPISIDKIIDFDDVKISLDLFKNCFFENNYEFFELNTQFTNNEEFLIHNKTIKNCDFKFMKYKTNKNSVFSISGVSTQRTNKVILIDIMSNKFISNKKTKINDIKKISFIKDINKYNSLFDFKIHISHLCFDDIISIYNQHPNKNNKKYFRFKIIAIYYSNELDESLSMCFNYLVEIPKCEINLIDDFNKNQNIVHDVSDVSDVSDIRDVSDVSQISQVKNKLDLFNKKENIVYSNYNKNKDKILNNHELESLKSVVNEKQNLSYSNYKNYIVQKQIIHETSDLEDEDEDEDDCFDNSSCNSLVKNDENDDIFLHIS